MMILHRRGRRVLLLARLREVRLQLPDGHRARSALRRHPHRPRALARGTRPVRRGARGVRGGASSFRRSRRSVVRARASRGGLGNEQEARRILAELTEARSTRVVSAWGIAVLHASLGDIDEAFRWLEAAIEEHAPGLAMLRAHPRLDPIRNDPRYRPLVQRLGLDTA